jgi:uncharacterized protein (TIGR02271 family)
MAKGFKDQVRDGMDVFDADNQKVGTVAETDTASAPRPAGDGEQTLELREEELRARKHSVQTGQVEVAKEVVSEQRTIDVPVTHEEVTIERRTVDHQPSESPIDGTDATISLPVREEQVIADKRAVVYEEVNVGKRAVQDTERVSETVRREQAVVDKEGAVKIEGEKLA